MCELVKPDVKFSLFHSFCMDYFTQTGGAKMFDFLLYVHGNELMMSCWSVNCEPSVRKVNVSLAFC